MICVVFAWPAHEPALSIPIIIFSIKRITFLEIINESKESGNQLRILSF